MSDEKQGFEIFGKFFPFVGYDEWLNRDFVLATVLTEKTTDELFEDATLMQQALVAIAFAHESPELSRDQVVAFIGGLKPVDMVEVGFEQQERPSPLLEKEPTGKGGSSTVISDEPSEADREKLLIESSGGRGSDIGSPE